MMGKRLRAVCWAYDAYHYQRDKPHGKKATVYHALMLAWMGAHLIWTGGRCWKLPWAGPSYWLLLIGQRRLNRSAPTRTETE